MHNFLEIILLCWVQGWAKEMELNWEKVSARLQLEQIYNSLISNSQNLRGKISKFASAILSAREEDDEEEENGRVESSGGGRETNVACASGLVCAQGGGGGGSQVK